MLVRSTVTNSEMCFAGIPMGHEFTSLVMALLHSGSHPLKIDRDVIEQVRQLEGEYQFESYISLSYQTSTTLAGWRQLTWPLFWFDFKACFFL